MPEGRLPTELAAGRTLLEVGPMGPGEAQKLRAFFAARDGHKDTRVVRLLGFLGPADESHADVVKNLTHTQQHGLIETASEYELESQAPAVKQHHPAQATAALRRSLQTTSSPTPQPPPPPTPPAPLCEVEGIETFNGAGAVAEPREGAALIGTGFSVSVWFKRGQSGSSHERVFDFGQPQSASERGTILLSFKGGLNFRVYSKAAPGGFSYYTDKTLYDGVGWVTNEWTHIAVTLTYSYLGVHTAYGNDVAYGDMRFYVNGVQTGHQVQYMPDRTTSTGQPATRPNLFVGKPWEGATGSHDQVRRGPSPHLSPV